MIVLMLMLTVLTGCSATATNFETRPFFQPEQGVELHGRKTWFDHLVEFDPGKVGLQTVADYQNEAPERIAVLPFVDQGTAQFRVDRIALTRRTGDLKNSWAWTYANRLRRSFAGQLAEREFTIVPIPEVDTILQDHGINNWKKLMAVPPEQFAQWLGVDTVVYGQVLNYDAYYALLLAAWDVGVNVQLVSTHDGRRLFQASDSRYSVDVRPCFDMMDFGINSALSLLELRDVTLARAEDEVSREIALRVPVSDRAVRDLQVAARSREEAEPQEARSEQPVLFDPAETTLDLRRQVAEPVSVR